MNTPLKLMSTLMLTTVLAHGGTPAMDLTKSAKAVAPIEDTAWGGPVLGGGIKGNSEFVEGSLFLVQPLLNTIGEGGTMSGSVLFVEPYAIWGEGGELGGSLGLGFRHLFSDQSTGDARSSTVAGLLTEGFFVGGNVFLDYAQTAASNDFWQMGVGLEAGTRYVEVRGNYYIPLSDDRVISRRTETEIDRSSKTTTKNVYGGTSVSGGQVVQNVTKQSRTATTTTVTRRTFETYEEPLEGWDVELALLVPGLDRVCDVKVIGGYYSFEGDRSSLKVDGWRAGVEIRPVPAVVLHGTWYENKSLYGEEWVAGVRLEIPLGGGLKEAFTPRRRHLAERLYEPVRRKNSSITSSGSETEETSTSTSSGTTTVISESPTQIILGPAETPVIKPLSPT